MHFTSLYISNCRSYLCAIWPWRLDRPDCKSQGQFCNFGGRARRNCFAWWLLSHVSLWNLATACCMFPWDIDHMLLEKLLVLLPFLTPGITTRSTAFPLNHSASPYLILLTVLRVTRLHLFSGESGNYNNHDEFMPWIQNSDCILILIERSS